MSVLKVFVYHFYHCSKATIKYLLKHTIKPEIPVKPTERSNCCTSNAFSKRRVLILFLVSFWMINCGHQKLYLNLSDFHNWSNSDLYKFFLRNTHFGDPFLVYCRGLKPSYKFIFKVSIGKYPKAILGNFK